MACKTERPPAGVRVTEMTGGGPQTRRSAPDTQAAAARARGIVMQVERDLGFEPVDRELDRVGYDIGSRVPGTGQPRFIEAKGRVTGAETITVTRNEIPCSLNKPEGSIPAMVEFDGDNGHRVRYLWQPFQNEPDLDAASVNYSFAKLLACAEAPR